MKIVIATGIYPPEIGGPAEYAKNLKEVWQREENKVDVCVFSKFNFLPTGIRHLAYLFYIVPSILKSDFVLILDTFSAALPAVLVAKIFRKKTILRTGGDFLWEAYVERTRQKILLRNFYKQNFFEKFSKKEKITFKLIRFVLQNVDLIIWSTKWQKDIFMEPYGLSNKKHAIVQNYVGSGLKSSSVKNKVFLAASRKLVWKNNDLLQDVFKRSDVCKSGAELDMNIRKHDEYLQKISQSRAIILVSLGDISPNSVLDAISCGTPFIVTREIGFYDLVKDVAIFVDPLNLDDIAKKVLWLTDDNNYLEQKKKVESFTYTHDWVSISKEYIAVYSDIIHKN